MMKKPSANQILRRSSDAIQLAYKSSYLFLCLQSKKEVDNYICITFEPKATRCLCICVAKIKQNYQIRLYMEINITNKTTKFINLNKSECSLKGEYFFTLIMIDMVPSGFQLRRKFPGIFRMKPMTKKMATRKSK